MLPGIVLFVCVGQYLGCVTADSLQTHMFIMPCHHDICRGLLQLPTHTVHLLDMSPAVCGAATTVHLEPPAKKHEA